VLLNNGAIAQFAQIAIVLKTLFSTTKHCEIATIAALYHCYVVEFEQTAIFHNQKLTTVAKRHTKYS